MPAIFFRQDASCGLEGGDNNIVGDCYDYDNDVFRAYYKDSYIVQRREEKKKTKKTVKPETEEAKVIYEQIQNSSCGKPLLHEKTMRNKNIQVKI